MTEQETAGTAHPLDGKTYYVAGEKFRVVLIPLSEEMLSRLLDFQLVRVSRPGNAEILIGSPGDLDMIHNQMEDSVRIASVGETNLTFTVDAERHEKLEAGHPLCQLNLFEQGHLNALLIAYREGHDPTEQPGWEPTILKDVIKELL